MNISSLTPTWFSFLVVTYNLRDLESNPTTATNPSCGVGKPWYLCLSFPPDKCGQCCFLYQISSDCSSPHAVLSPAAPLLQQQEPGRSLGGGRRLEMVVCHLGQSLGLPCLCYTYTVPAGGFFAVCLPLVLAV